MRIVPRHIRLEQRARDLAKIEHIINTVGGDDHTPQPVHATTHRWRNTPADARVMRAIPICAEGVPGTIPDTNPLDMVIAKEQRSVRHPR